MASWPATTADDLPASVRSIVDKVLEADLTDAITQRGKEIAAAVTDASEAAAERAQDAWRESEPLRRDAARSVARASRDASRWGRSTWAHQLRPQLKGLWKQRTLALGAAGAAIPVGRELVDSAAERLRLRRRREERHWGAFFAGLLLGAAGGALVALLTAPKPGREMRDELAEKAREAAGSAGEWVPLFQHSQADGGPEVQASVDSINGASDEPRAPRPARRAKRAADETI